MRAQPVARAPERGPQRVRWLCGVLCLAASLLVRPAAACPTSSAANGLDGTAYSCTNSFDATDCVTAGSLTGVTGVFDSPERTGVALAASENLGFTVKCAAVADQGIENQGTTAVSVKGCYSDPSFSISGKGAVVVTATSNAAACPPADCTCTISNGFLQSTTGSHSGTWDDNGDEASPPTCDHDNDGGTADNGGTPDQAHTNCATARVSCGCTCEQYTCTMTKSFSNKKGEISGGNSAAGGHTQKAAGSCILTAACSSGFLDGQTYTAYAQSIGVTLTDAGGTDRSSHLDGTAPSARSSGVYTFANLHVDLLAIHNNELTVTFTATGTSKHQTDAGYVDGAVTASRGTFKVYPTDFRFVQAEFCYPGAVSGNPQYVSNSVYTVGSVDANLGFYAIQLLDNAGNVITTVDYGSDAERKPNDVFNATVQVITGLHSAAPLAAPTGAKQDSTSDPTTSSSVTLDKSDVVVTAKGTKYLSNAEWEATCGTVTGDYIKEWNDGDPYIKASSATATASPGQGNYAFTCSETADIQVQVQFKSVGDGADDSVTLELDGANSATSGNGDVHFFDDTTGVVAVTTDWTWSAAQRGGNDQGKFTQVLFLLMLYVQSCTLKCTYILTVLLLSLYLLLYLLTVLYNYVAKEYTDIRRTGDCRVPHPQCQETGGELETEEAQVRGGR